MKLSSLPTFCALLWNLASARVYARSERSIFQISWTFAVVFSTASRFSTKVSRSYAIYISSDISFIGQSRLLFIRWFRLPVVDQSYFPPGYRSRIRVRVFASCAQDVPSRLYTSLPLIYFLYSAFPVGITNIVIPTCSRLIAYFLCQI